MMVELSISKRGRTCSLCGKSIDKEAKHFVTTDWASHVRYPIKRNVCFNCAESFTNPLFVESMEILVKKLKKMQSILKTQSANIIRKSDLDVPF